MILFNFCVLEHSKSRAEPAGTTSGQAAAVVEGDGRSDGRRDGDRRQPGSDQTAAGSLQGETTYLQLILLTASTSLQVNSFIS